MKKTNMWYGIAVCLAIVAWSSVSPGQMRSGKLGVGASGSVYLFTSNLDNGVIKGGGGLNLSYSAMEHLGIRAMFGSGQLGYKYQKNDKENPYTTTIFSGNLYVSYDVIPHGQLNPYVFVGVGGLYFDPRSDDGVYPTGGFDKMDINYIGGAGFDFFFSEFYSLSLSGEIALTNTSKLDFPKMTQNNEMFSRINLEFRYYFFDQDYITRLIKALQARYKK
jgi:opacity protein-like surface antigen